MIKALYEPIAELETFRIVRDRMKKNRGMIQINGCTDSQKVHLIACLSENYLVTMIIAQDELRAKEIFEDYQVFNNSDVMIYPAKDFMFSQADMSSRTLTAQRVRVMRALSEASARESGWKKQEAASKNTYASLAVTEPSDPGRHVDGNSTAAELSLIHTALPRHHVTVILTQSALMSRCMRSSDWSDAARSFTVGDEIDFDLEKKELSLIGYERADLAENAGQFAVRGGILDIFPLTEEEPVRIELCGDEIESIRTFDAVSQRTIEEIGSVKVYPASEFVVTKEMIHEGLLKIKREAFASEKKFRLKGMTQEAFRISRGAEAVRERLEDFGDNSAIDSFCDYFYPQAVSLLDYFPENAAIFVDEPARAMQSAREVEAEFAESIKHRLENGYALPLQATMLFSSCLVGERLADRGFIGLTVQADIKGIYPITFKCDIQAQGTGVYNSNFSLLARDLTRYCANKYRTVLLCASRTRGRRLATDLTENGVNAFYSENPDRVPARGTVMVTYGNAHRGYEYPLIKFAVLSESDIFGHKKRARRKKNSLSGKAIASFIDLHPGDYVVHENHGIGMYQGVERITVDGIQKDYIKIGYARGSNLYVNATQLDLVQKYSLVGQKAPKLSTLGGETWMHTRARVRKAVEEIAQDLVELYAVRSRSDGFACGPDTVWQKEFEELFPFEETQDQLAAIEDTKRDMESTKIMDRLICGDVGYGKTEIAVRAAFKCVADGRQAAFLVPTTILAQQHYNTFVQRMKDYPVRIDLMSRFRTKSELSETLKALEDGRADIVIGTHRLLSGDVKFKNLGLLIIDEEQRFGVAHKEKIKNMRRKVDVLTLTATPIPRTLHMSLIGIRDMSVLEEAPEDRLPIQTFVMEYSEETIREAICREMARGGQVYLVYNHISTIADMAVRVEKLVPQARVACAHGQMRSNKVEDIMYDFVNGDIDVLVATTIIETGLDIPNVNTMIICDADRMGLSQLYQLRGRVGRSNRTAYAFLMYKGGRILRESSEKRLGAIREYTALGSGFRIAMRDLEIRGAGNLLGKAQSGHMAEVGYDLYCKLLNEAVTRLKGGSVSFEEFDTTIDLNIDAYLPDSYIPDENQKLDLYKRIASIRGKRNCQDMIDELTDRYGDPPECVQNLLKAALIKNLAHKCYITDLSQRGGQLRFIFYQKAPADAEKMGLFMRKQKGRLRFVAGSKACFTYTLPKSMRQSKDILDWAGLLFTDMKNVLFPENQS